MRKWTIGLLAASLMLLGCVVVRIPDGLIDNVSLDLHDIQVGSVCTHEGKAYSAGSRLCMGDRKMECEVSGRWGELGSC
jgi:hypothetical protein